MLKVRINAHMGDRVRAMAAREGLSSDDALAMVNRVDEERKNWSLKLYGIDTWDSRLYDLVITIGNFSVEESVDMICGAVDRPGFKATPDSLKRMDELTAEARKMVEEGRSPFLEPMRVSLKNREKYKKTKIL